MITLAKREKVLVISAGCIILALIAFELAINPFFEEKKRLTRGIAAKEIELKEILMGSAEYKSIKKNNQELKKRITGRDKGVTLFSFLEREADASKIKGHIEYMKPSVSQGSGDYKESMVEMKLKGITLKQLVGYIYRIESPKDLISIKRISVKEDKKDSGYLDVILQVMTVQ